MDLRLPIDVAQNYSSGSQRIRVMTEYWVNHSVFCPNCGNALRHFGNNAPVADFYCERCWEEYELKAKNGTVGKKIVDGAYETMIERLQADNNPNLFFLSYKKATLEIRNFLTRNGKGRHVSLAISISGSPQRTPLSALFRCSYEDRKIERRSYRTGH